MHMSQVSEPASKQDKSDNQASLERMPDTEGAVSFVDNRASTVAQSKLANTMKASSSMALQRKSLGGMFGAPLKPVQVKTAIAQRAIAEGSEEIKPGEKYQSPTQTGASSITKLYSQAYEAQFELFAKTKEVASITKGAPSFPPGLKDLNTAKDKVLREYGEDASKIVDLVRATIVYKDVAALLKAMPVIQGQFNIVRLKNKFMNVTPSGYRDINMNVQFSNGHIGELQLNLTEVLALKEAQHKEVYEVERAELQKVGGDKGKLPAEVKAKLDALEAESLIKFDAAMAKAGSKEDEEKLKGIKEVGVKAVGDKKP
jgi:hypothetical protein